MNGSDYKRMRDKLSEAVRHICETCDTPLIPQSELKFDDPQKCACRCDRVARIQESLRGLDESTLLFEDDCHLHPQNG